MIGVIPDMAIEPEVKEILDEHGNRIKAVEDDITELKISNARTEEKLINIEQNQLDLKNIVLQGNTATLGVLQQILVSKDNKEVVTSTNNSKIITQLIISLGTVIVAVVGAIYAVK